ncbi:MAG: MotA/TolQ/ExbB proton channel family protein [Bacteroidales bacterium]|nr:MotA/TolQ/ExbB proton channel family protein [Bacteroidales bacterium]HPB06374.1 MotA/TolQ/ExbB proton channel family protein [Prolixibacteraceae bacterium]
MKKLFALIAVLTVFVLGSSVSVKAQETEAPATEQVAAAQPAADVAADKIENAAKAAEEGQSLHSALKQKFIEGGPGFMTSILICLILGLALAIERVIYLNLATTNTKKLLTDVEQALNKGGYEAAKEVCRNTRGPVASIFYQGLDRHNEGVEVIEKSIISYGGVQMGLLERNLSWIGLFIALGPMLGFLGTVIGMIQAFDAIEVAGDISPTLVAAGIKVALITTVFGLIVAMILQIFYNYCLSKIDSITGDMEESSISLLDMIVKYNIKK